MSAIEDYSWLVENEEKSSGMLDYIECMMEIEKKHDKAKKMTADAAKKGVVIATDNSELVDTCLMWPNFDASVLSLGPDELRDRFSIVIDFFEEFDREREKLMSAKTSLAEGIVWGFWRQSYGTQCGLPETTEFTVQFSPARDGVPNFGTRHGYEEETPVVEWALRSFEQTGVNYFVGAASFAEIDALTRVPSYPNSVSDEEWAKRALDPEPDDDQFQRPLDLDRMQDIQAFVRPIANRILNSVILFIPPESVEGDDASVVLEDKGKGAARLTVDVGKFTQRHDDGVKRSWEQKTQRDLRPIMLIDGQHRTRGGAISPEGKDKRVPVVILPSEIGLAEVARVFTEINTGSEELQKLLQLHLRHRFALASAKLDKDFSHWQSLDGGRRRQRCRANRMSYELAARCCSDGDGAIHRRIRMMDVGSGGTNIATNAQEFVGLAHQWFMPSGPFGAEATDLDFAHGVVSDYLRAWQMVADHEAVGIDPWPDPETNRWYPQPQKGTSGKPKSPYITMQIPFKAVLMTFPLAYELAVASMPQEQDKRIPGRDNFIQVLQPLQALDWSQIDRIKQAYGTDKYTQFDLYNWFSWALQDYSKNGVIHPLDKVWNPDDPRPEDCMPGRGFFSPTSSDLVQVHASVETGDLWPTEGDSLHFWSPLVPNACRTVQWQLNVDGEATPAQTKAVSDDGSLHTIGTTVDLARASIFTVDVFWSRSRSGRMAPAAKTTLKIAKDDDGYVSIIGADDKPVKRAKPPKNIAELEALDEGEYVIAADYGEGAIMPPPPPNQLREASGESRAPSRFRIPWCTACFFGLDCTKNHCAVRDRGIPKA